MLLRNYEPKIHYEQLMGFWEHKGRLARVPPEFLPPTGRVVYNNGALICGGFLVKSDTAVACIGSVAANPAADKHVRSEALDLLIADLSELAQKGGFTYVTMATNVPALQKRYERLNFIPTDFNVVCYARRVL